MEAELAKEPTVRDRMANVGRGNPQLFYNVRETAQQSSYAMVGATLKDWDQHETPALIERLRARFAAYPEARITLEPFKNGAPIDAPIMADGLPATTF